MITRRGRPTQAEAKELHEKLREAAIATFLEYGYDATTMEAIAQAAGITKRTLYARYPDKRAVFLDVIDFDRAGRLVVSKQIHDLSLPARPAQCLRADREFCESRCLVSRDAVQSQGIRIQRVLERAPAYGAQRGRQIVLAQFGIRVP